MKGKEARNEGGGRHKYVSFKVQEWSLRLVVVEVKLSMVNNYFLNCSPYTRHVIHVGGITLSNEKPKPIDKVRETTVLLSIQ